MTKRSYQAQSTPKPHTTLRRDHCPVCGQRHTPDDCPGEGPDQDANEPRTVTCRTTHPVDSEDGTVRHALAGETGRATWEPRLGAWSIVWARGAWGVYSPEELAEVRETR